MKVYLYRPQQFPLSLVVPNPRKINEIKYNDDIFIQYEFDVDSFVEYPFNLLPNPYDYIPEILVLLYVPSVFAPSSLLTGNRNEKLYNVSVSNTKNPLHWYITDARYSLPSVLPTESVCRILSNMVEEYKTIKLEESL